MASSTFLWSVPLVLSAFTLNPDSNSLAASGLDPVRLAFAYFEPPCSIGTPIEDVARAYTGSGLAPKIEGRLRLDTDASLDAATRELIRRTLAQQS